MISIVVPTGGRRDSLFRLLESIDQQSIVSELEVIVVVNGVSPADCILPLEEASYWFPLRAVVLSEPGTNRARNYGAHLAHGESLVFLDDDCELQSPLQLKNIEEFLVARSSGAVFGEYIDALEFDWASRVYNCITNSWMDCYYKDPKKKSVFAGGAFAISKKVFWQYGGFDDKVFGAGEEWSLASKLEDHELRYCSHMGMIHSFQGGWKRLLKRTKDHVPMPDSPSFLQKIKSIYQCLTTTRGTVIQKLLVGFGVVVYGIFQILQPQLRVRL